MRLLLTPARKLHSTMATKRNYFHQLFGSIWGKPNIRASKHQVASNSVSFTAAESLSKNRF